ncbi:MAG: YdcF family protein [Candidatus Hydrogenedens sp.]|nr:YdcF family protein [Candidatus Hydrogenedens sp.]
MFYVLYSVLRELLLPPTVLLILLVSGVLLGRRWPRAGWRLVVAATVGLVVLGMPAVGRLLLGGLEHAPPILRPLPADYCGAVVVLGGGIYPNAGEQGGETVSAATLARLRFGVLLARESGIPLLLSGGRPGGTQSSEAAVMRHVAVDELGGQVRWLEESSRNTREQATATWTILHRDGIARICLVTDARHMGRAGAAFAAVGFDVVPAPHDIARQPELRVLDLIPSADGFTLARQVAIEWFGRAVYAVLGSG